MVEDALDQALLLLTGPAARFITGSTITIDDGQSLQDAGLTMGLATGLSA